jgi:hypothetical protein
MPWLLAEIADPLNSLKDSFPRAHFDPWVLGAVFAGIIAVLIGLVVLNRLLTRRASARKAENPEGVFDGLVHRLKLTEDERRLLREMTTGAMLKHPAMSLLSPGLLDWTRKVWLAEQGPAVVTPDKQRRVDDLCRKLFDQPTPSMARSSASESQ